MEGDAANDVALLGYPLGVFGFPLIAVTDDDVVRTGAYAAVAALTRGWKDSWPTGRCQHPVIRGSARISSDSSLARW